MLWEFRKERCLETLQGAGGEGRWALQIWLSGAGPLLVSWQLGCGGLWGVVVSAHDSLLN